MSPISRLGGKLEESGENQKSGQGRTVVRPYRPSQMTGEDSILRPVSERSDPRHECGGTEVCSFCHCERA